MKFARLILLTVLVFSGAVYVDGQAISEPESIVVRSGSLQLKALIWRPKGKGPFPAVLFNHGRGLTPQTEGRVAGITRLGRTFVSHGYVFMALFRRGEDLSADQGEFIGDLLERERAAKGDDAAKKLQVRLLESDHLEDSRAGLAFVRALPEVDRKRVAVVGHSFGGSLALLVAARDKPLKAVVNFAGAAGSWDESAYLRETLIAAVGRLTVPVLFVYAVNDSSVTAGRVLAAEMTRHSKPNRLKIFPPFGKSVAEAHWLVYLGIASWEQDVFVFLDEHMKPDERNLGDKRRRN